jgi:hypothetical protein
MHVVTQVRVAGSQLRAVPQSAALAHSPQRPTEATQIGALRRPTQSLLLAHCKQPIPGEHPCGQRATLALHVPEAPCDELEQDNKRAQSTPCARAAPTILRPNRMCRSCAPVRFDTSPGSFASLA